MYRLSLFIVFCLLAVVFVKTIGDEKALGQVSKCSASPVSVINPKLEPDTFYIKPMPRESYIDSIPEGLEYSEYILEVAIHAVDAYKLTSMLPSVSIALSIHESGGGQSELYKNCNSAHGIKCGSSALTTDLCNSNGRWKAYEDVSYSFLDFGLFWHKHVPVIYDVCGDDWRKWCKLIPRNGYASGKHNDEYTKALISIISKYKLYEIDKEVRCIKVQ